MTRVLALDHGSARCGVAVSDPTGTIVTPLEPVLRPDTKPGLETVSALCREIAAETVVVGLPLSLGGGDSDQSRAARRFARRLEARIRPIPVELSDERLTTAEARSRGGTASEDSRAAAVLLEGWLEARGVNR